MRSDLHRGRARLLLGMVVSGLQAAVLSTAAGAESGPRAAQDEMAVLVGRARLAAGLLPLARDAALDQAAATHAEDMAAHGYMEHEGLDGSTPASRAAEAGYQTPAGSAWLVVEVISARGDPPQDALEWWLGDGLHRRVVLRPTWREMGVGFARGGPYGRFWVVLFGCRPNVLPPVLLEGVLTIPDENCGAAPDTFGHVEAVRAATGAASIDTAEWEPYASTRRWALGQQAIVQLRDTAGHIVQAAATDLGAAVAEVP